MSADVDVRDEAAGFVDKWRSRWPEWAVAIAFVPAGQQRVAEAWLTLLQELTGAAWGGGDPTPGLAKLAWWQEELGGWAKGARRHPLGALLQPLPAPWLELGRALPDLRALRAPDDVGDLVGPHARVQGPGVGAGPAAGVAAGQAFAAVVADCELGLFGGRAADAAAAGAVLRSLLVERALLTGAPVAPTGGDDRAPGPLRPASRPRGVQLALAEARLARPGAPLSPLRTLFTAWRGARRAG